MKRRTWLRIAALCVIGVTVLWVAGSFLMEQGVEEYYSRGWQSTSTRDAQLREVFVTAPAVMPAAVAVSDAVEAWVNESASRPWTSISMTSLQGRVEISRPKS